MIRMGRRKPCARRSARYKLDIERLEARELLAYTPAQMLHAYGIDQVKFSNGTVKGDGSGQTIAIVDAFDDPTILSDLQKFDATYGLPDPPSFQKLTPQGQPAANTGWALEIALDVEWAHAIAPKANIILVESADNSGANLYAADVFAASQTGVSVVSNSWGGAEYSGETSADSNFVHSGVTFIFSSGDSGAPPEYASASPNVLSVGGTTLNLDSSGNWVSETGWSGSGGGPSAYEAKPSFQSSVTISSTRATPDVAFDADPNTGVAVYDSNNGGWLQVGGTSLGAPSWAGLIAIVDQGRALNGQSSYSSSDLLTQIYKVSSSDFHDITSGNNGYAAGTGYDFVTGRGSPIANLLIPDLVGGSSQPPVVPPVPTGLTATAGDGQVVLSWSASSGATTYNIYRSLTPGGEGSTPFMTGVTTTSFTDTGLTDGTTYYYTVTAVNSAGESSQSSEVSATPKKAATTLAIDAGGGASGNWVSDTDFSGGRASSTTHSIDTSNVTNPAAQTVYQTQRIGDFTYTVPNLTPGATYTVRLSFAELHWPIAGIRKFNVTINGTQVLTNFDIFATAGGKFKAITESFTATADANGKITIKFTSVRDKAALNGLEILSSSSAAAIGTHWAGLFAHGFHHVAKFAHFIPADSIQPDAHAASRGFGEFARLLSGDSTHSGTTGGALGGGTGVGGITAADAAVATIQNAADNRASDAFAFSPHRGSVAETDWTGDQLGELEV
jgi:subtilase family serine protease